MKKLIIFYSLICLFSCNEEKTKEEELVQELLNVAKKHKTKITNLNELKAHLNSKAIYEFDSFMIATSSPDETYGISYGDTFIYVTKAFADSAFPPLVKKQ